MSAYVKTSAPHIHASDSVAKILWSVALALLPAIFVQIFFYPLESLRLLIASNLGAYAAVVLAAQFHAKPPRLQDATPLSVSLILVLMLPLSTPTWAVILSAFVGVFVGRELFGGLGYHFFHPSLVGLLFLYALIPEVFAMSLDSTGVWGSGALMLGGAFLIWRKVCRLDVSFIYFFVILLNLIAQGQNFWEIFEDPFLFLAGFFLISDSLTTPMTRQGQRLFALSAAVLTSALRMLLPVALAVAFAVFLTSSASSWMDQVTAPQGRIKRKRKKS